MQWGLSIRLKSNLDIAYWSLPPPSSERCLTSMDGTKSLNVLYHFLYAPQSWKEWQRLAAIKIQIQKNLRGVEFEEYEPYEVTGHIYTIAELGKSFPEFIKFQKPLYPINKSEFLRSLTIYAMRLHYENMFHYEAILAMAIRFNSIIKGEFSFREVNRKARAVCELDRSKWKVKLSKEERHRVLSNSAMKAAEIKRVKSQSVRDEAIALRKSGKTLRVISDILNISISSVRRYTA